MDNELRKLLDEMPLSPVQVEQIAELMRGVTTQIYKDINNQRTNLINAIAAMQVALERKGVLAEGEFMQSLKEVKEAQKGQD